MMDTDNITQELNRRFAEPLPDFYTRRIIVWKDEEQEYADKLEGFELENAKLLVLTGRNQFEVKKLIAREEKHSNLLIYSPLNYENREDNWLLDVELYGEVFRADLLSQWLKEMDIDNTPSLREEVKKYRSYFNSAAHRKKIYGMGKHITKPNQVALVVLAAICGVKDPTPANIIRQVMAAEFYGEENALYAQFRKHKITGMFWTMVMQATGYTEETPSIRNLCAHILLTACAQTMSMDYLRGLEQWISQPFKSYCYDIAEGLLNRQKELYQPIAEYVETEYSLYHRFSSLTVDDIVQTECFPCIDGIILLKLMQEIKDNSVKAEMIQAVYDTRKTVVWFGDVAPFYDGILQYANMLEFYLNHGEGYHTVEPEKVWKAYTEDYYQMDSYYRHFHACYAAVKVSDYELPGLEDSFKAVVSAAEQLYVGKFLTPLSEHWSKISEAELEQFGYVSGILPQTRFYDTYIKHQSTVTVVIVSDALRFEVAAELAKVLAQENHGNVKLESCEAVFPAVTKYGMAALLPHKKLSLEMKSNGLSILADGVPTDSGYREKILTAANKNSAVVRYADFANKNMAERREITKGKEVVYIYHDLIDAAGHSPDQSTVFPKCSEAVEQLKKLVKDVLNCNITRILITADHGFLYTDAPLKESDKMSKGGFGAEAVETDPRYVIMDKDTKPDYLMPVKLLDGDTGYSAFAAKGCIRISTAASKNYVHGGASLQELVVPVIEFYNVRTSYKEYSRNKGKYETKPVEIEILDSSRKISNSIVPIRFYQKDAVGSTRTAVSYDLFFEDADGAQISDVQTIIADSAETDVKNREYKVTFNFKQMSYSKLKNYYLVIMDQSGKQAPKKEPYSIDIAFGLEGFTF